MPDVTFVPVVVRGGRPEKPPNAESLGLSDTLCGLVQCCQQGCLPISLVSEEYRKGS